MKVDYERFVGLLPYSSELLGVYQPLLGWKSKRLKRRFHKGVASFRPQLIAYIKSKIYAQARYSPRDRSTLAIDELHVGAARLTQRSGLSPQIDSLVARSVLDEIHARNVARDDDRIWEDLLQRESLEARLRDIQQRLQSNPALVFSANASPVSAAAFARQDPATAIRQFAERESTVAGLLAEMRERRLFAELRELFFPPDAAFDLGDYMAMKAFVDPLETFEPRSDIDRVALSPVGVVHLYRQYFFEFDTFLGPPVQHIWLSPGSSVELIEIHSRKTVTERYTEASTETSVKTEKSLTEEDELSRAVHTENQSNTKFGVSANVDGGVNLGVYSMHASVSTHYGFENNEKEARERVHKQTRQQTSKLASEIKKNFKTTFKTTTEIQDTTSKRYLLQNTTPDLVNYELRRKMRQVGVQLQDIGAQLCWQTYVDLPGNDLGVSRLVHIAEPPDLSSLKQPEAPTRLEPKVVDFQAPFPYENTSGSDEKDVTFYRGSDEESWPDHNDTIIWVREFKADPPDHGYTLDANISVAAQHSSTCVATPKLLDASGRFQISLDQVNFDDQSSINLKVTLRWNPPDQAAAEAKFKTESEKYDREKERLTKEAFIKAARERIEAAANIEPRPSLDLREEERIIVYRKLIGSLLNVGVSLDNPRTRHVAAEIINAMFDVDKMLYFVAPEWWRPRLHAGHQELGVPDADGKADMPTRLTAENLVSWGGAREPRADNYYITEKSKTARLGSSLGWLLQLDGDNLRNAFLNAPWVKAVIPIRLGRELAALNWLMHASVEGADGLDAKYQASSAIEAQQMASTLKAHPWTDAPDVSRYGAAFSAADITLRDALKYLAVVVKTKATKSTQKKTEVVDGETLSYLPTDKVYEHGFYPLQGGFEANSPEPFEVFDQWIEVLPTDQVVAVEVQYDPKTGRQK